MSPVREPTLLGIEHALVVGGVDVAHHPLRPADPDLAGLSLRQDAAVFVDAADLRTGADRPVGVAPHLDRQAAVHDRRLRCSVIP